MRRRERVAAREHLAQAAEALQLGVDHAVEQAGRHPEGGDPLADDGLGEVVQRQRTGPVDDQSGAVEQGPPDLERGRVEGQPAQLQERLVGGERGVVVGLDQAHDAAVPHGHALGPAGRARGVADVSQVVRSRAGLERPVQDDLLDAAVEVHHGRVDLGDPVGQPAVGEQHAGARLLEHVAEPVRRLGRVQRQVRAAGLEDGHERDHHLERALDEHPDGALGDDAERTQVPAEQVGPPVELGVGHVDAVEPQGDRVGATPDLLVEQVGDGRVPPLPSSHQVPPSVGRRSGVPARRGHEIPRLCSPSRIVAARSESRLNDPASPMPWLDSHRPLRNSGGVLSSCGRRL